MRISMYELEMNFFGEPEMIKDYSKNYQLIGTIINNPDAVVKMLNDLLKMDKRPEEYVYLITTNTRHKPNGIHMISKGSVDAALCPPTNIFTRVLLSGCKNFFLAHNHPSGDPKPSKEDKRVCFELIKGADLLGLKLDDFIILGKNNSYYSFYKERKIL